MTQLADAPTPGTPSAHADGVPLTREEQAYLRGLPSPAFPPPAPVHTGPDAALAAWEAREDRRREIVRRYRAKGVLPDDWDIRITWIRMDPRSYYAIQRAARTNVSQSAVATETSPVEEPVTPVPPVTPESPRRTWWQRLITGLHPLRP